MRILVVDDDEAIREFLKNFLIKSDHIVFEGSDGMEALEIIKRESIHLVLTDLKMPEMDGMELLKRIKNKYPEIVVVIFTGHGDVTSAVEAMKNGAQDYLQKPINLEELMILIDKIGEYISMRSENIKLTKKFKKTVNEATKEVKEELQEVRKAFAREVGLSDIGVFSDSLRRVFKTAGKLHKNPDVPVLIEGETGTGKELIARYIHYGKGDVVKTFIDLNCAAVSSTLFESELFGYEAGAFTGGNPKGQKGKLEMANDGTIFLDEITEMPVELQAKLLRVIQERKFYKVGGLKKITTGARFLCATNQDIRKMVNEGKFRQDLYFRLNVGYIKVPPLRERREEIIPLSEMFLNSLIREKRTQFIRISPEAAKMLENYHWPGNIRELKNTIERIALLWEDTVIEPDHLEFIFREESKASLKRVLHHEISLDNFSLPQVSLDLNSYNLKIVEKALEKFHWNQTKTAQYLGITLRVLHTYLKKIETEKQ